MSIVSEDGRISIPKGREMTTEEKLRLVQALCEDWSLCRDKYLRFEICRAMGWKLPMGAVP